MFRKRRYTSRVCTTRRCRTRCSSAAARPCTTRPTSPARLRRLQPWLCQHPGQEEAALRLQPDPARRPGGRLPELSDPRCRPAVAPTSPAMCQVRSKVSSNMGTAVDVGLAAFWQPLLAAAFLAVAFLVAVRCVGRTASGRRLGGGRLLGAARGHGLGGGPAGRVLARLGDALLDLLEGRVDRVDHIGAHVPGALLGPTGQLRAPTDRLVDGPLAPAGEVAVGGVGLPDAALAPASATRPAGPWWSPAGLDLLGQRRTKVRSSAASLGLLLAPGPARRRSAGWPSPASRPASPAGASATASVRPAAAYSGV